MTKKKQEEKKEERNNLRLLVIPKDTPNNRMLNILKDICICFESVEKAEKPIDFSSTIPPFWLTVQTWNNFFAEDFEEFELNFKRNKELLSEDAPYNINLIDLFNESLDLIYYYKDKDFTTNSSNEYEEEPNVKMGTKATEMVKKIRDVLPKPKDKLFGFNSKNLYSEENSKACDKRWDSLSNDERKFISELINKLTEECKAYKEEELVKALLEIATILPKAVTLEADETEEDMFLLILLVQDRITRAITRYQTFKEFMDSIKKRDLKVLIDSNQELLKLVYDLVKEDLDNDNLDSLKKTFESLDNLTSTLMERK